MPSTRAVRAPPWDIFCRVVDNFGDIGVCWRLAADLASRGEQVRLWTDNASALAWMAPQGAGGVSVRPWDAASDTEPGAVVIEAFGCDPPPAFVQRMAARASAPCWINLEYLSAEAYVDRSHGLRSPVFAGPGAGLVKWFFYPGFTDRTGGLIREPDLLERQRCFDAAAWLGAHGAARRSGERVLSLFCYEPAALPSLLDDLSRERTPTLLLAAAGHAARQAQQLLGPTLARGALRALLLPPLAQREYDHLLWACDLNFVRGEDSFVRAQWSGAPFVWQIYPQHDGAHLAKLNAFLDRFLAGAPEPVSADVRARWAAWNDTATRTSAQPFPDWNGWRQQARHWRRAMLRQIDLGTQLLGFVAERR